MSNSMKAASMLARAASDADFRARFIADPPGVSAECGVTIHPHPNYEILQDQNGVRHIVVTEEKHGSAADGDLSATPSIADVRRWATFHIHAGDATGTAIRNDINAAIAAAGAAAPGGMSFKVAVDDAQTMHIALPMAADTEVSMDQAEAFAGAGTEAAQVDTTVQEVEEVETTTTEATEVETTVAVAVEVAMVPGFVT
ncbi:MAG: nitrile hydratase subunit alpha [Phycisphaera sp.]|nr:nitrile hydratase subunit alpha [Phycisphaera sp.]